MFIKLLDIKNRIMVGVMMTLAAAMGGLVPTQGFWEMNCPRKNIPIRVY